MQQANSGDRASDVGRSVRSLDSAPMSGRHWNADAAGEPMPSLELCALVAGWLRGRTDVGDNRRHARRQCKGVGE